MQAEEALPVLRVSFPAKKLNYDEYLQGEMRLEMPNGSVTELPAQMKTRGATAKAYTMKPSFNIKLKDAEGNEIDSTLLDLRQTSSYILDAMAIDRICMRNRVAFDIWNAFSPLPYETDFDDRNGTIGKFVEVYMNDEYKGIYCMSDKINRKLLDLKKPQVADDGTVTVRGVLYKNGTSEIGKQEVVDFYNDSTVYVARYHDAWELKEPDDYPGYAAWAPLIAFYDNRSSYSYISEHFLIENIVDYTLFIMTLSIGDNWGNKNKYYSIQNCTKSGTKGKFIVTPWDLDTSLGGTYNGGYYGGTYSDWKPSDISKSASAPFSTCLGQAEVKAMLKARWIETRRGVFAVDSVAQRLYDYRDLFLRTGAWERQTTHWNAQSSKPCYVQDLAEEIDLIVEWYRNRHQQLDEYFNLTEEEMALDAIEADRRTDARTFNLMGQPVAPAHRTPGTLYIQGGRKVVYNGY